MGKLWLGTDKPQIQVALPEEPAPIMAATEHIAYVDRIIYVDKPVEVLVEKQVIVEVPVEKIVEKVVEKTVYVDKPSTVERIVHVDRPTVVEKIVTKEQPPVYIDRIVPVKSIPNWVWGVMALEAAALIASVL